MKQQVTGRNRPAAAAAAAAFSFQEELVAAIHGAFEVAVEIAVRDVKKLAGQATSDIYAELRRENDSLKERLQRAEDALELTRAAERGCRRVPPASQQSTKTKHEDQPPHPDCTPPSPYPKVGSVHSCAAGKADPLSLGGGVFQPGDPQDKHVCASEESGSNQDCDSNATSKGETDRSVSFYTEITGQLSQACVVKIESLNASCHKPGGQACETLPLPGKSSSEQVTVKQERLEDTIEGSSCCVDSIKMEDFSLEECLSPAQSKMLEQWKPVGPDSETQDLNFQLSRAELDQVDSSMETTSLCPHTDQLSAEFPIIFEGMEPAPPSEAAPQVYGVYVRTSRHINHSPHTCKSCGETFHLPSLLRRHNGQCQQRLQQRGQQPVTAGKKTRLQLFAPGCSPFRCTVCNREFNRLENLKTHLRIHTGERPYTCSVCSKCFRHSGALTRHFRIHTGEKPYVCGQCGKSFRNCGGLKFHQRSHNRQLQ